LLEKIFTKNETQSYAISQSMKYADFE